MCFWKTPIPSIELGRTGRLMAIQLESSEFDMEALYTLPQAISELPIYSELVLPEIIWKSARRQPYCSTFKLTSLYCVYPLRASM